MARFALACALLGASSASFEGRVALVITGGFSSPGHSFSGGAAAGVDVADTFVRLVAGTVRRRIVDANGDVDTFVFSWNPELEPVLESAYAPKRAAYVSNQPLLEAFEAAPGCRELQGQCWQSVSSAYALREGVKLVAAAERDGAVYDAVVFARPDVLYFDDVRVDRRLLRSAIQVPGCKAKWPGALCGDLHFVMSRAAADVAAQLYVDLAAEASGLQVREPRQCLKGEYVANRTGLRRDTRGPASPASECAYRYFGNICSCGGALLQRRTGLKREFADMNFTRAHLDWLRAARLATHPESPVCETYTAARDALRPPRRRLGLTTGT
ncbi:hypothetical protein M885DRAFT_547193 [Pelagophyceae sp. CCMP2097]|nr:hypothetical protein M885DRAFT_547193 [Pelagophyceae sp. CCMP2097]|mmetsp:Transcript_2434/g.8840  ORF Transcript_2434/g.8840 Transcript_2434/m.8840 type:complete len:327 (-) Transcript_2434:15-995(-)